MEVMWGIKNLVHSLVPEEKSQLAKEDRLQMSLGLKMLLNRYGFDVKPEIVSFRFSFPFVLPAMDLALLIPVIYF